MTVRARHNRDATHNTGVGTSTVDLDSIEGSKIVLFEIAVAMKKANLPKTFIVNATRVALDFEGMADLMHLWRDEKDQEERNEIIADIQDMINACAQTGISEEYVKFNDLDAIARNIRSFKDSLLSVVDKNGGIKNLAKLTDIPQPSLSRFFNSVSIPQRSTLLKISKALKLDELKIESLLNPKKGAGKKEQN